MIMLSVIIFLLCVQIYLIRTRVDKSQNTPSRRLDVLSINEKTELINKLVQTTVLWMIDNGIVKHIGEQYILQEPKEKPTDFSKRVYMTNFKAMTTILDVDEFYKNLPISTDIDFVEISQQLISMLSVLYGIDAVAFLKARIYNSLQIVSVDSKIQLYREIDESYPDFWIFIHMQSVLLQININIIFE